MLTDAPPRNSNRAGLLESDRIRTLDLRQDGRLLAITKSVECGMKAGGSADVRRVCAEFLDAASEFYKVPACGIRVLAARPLRVRESWSTELFGDYNPETMLIRVWMRTAVRKEITSFGTFLSTLCHEFCHHLDFQKFGFHDSWHTRSFYERAAALYHHSRGTPPKRLFWVALPGGAGQSTGHGPIAVADPVALDSAATGALCAGTLMGRGLKMNCHNAKKLALSCLLLVAVLAAGTDAGKLISVKGYVLDSACAFTKNLKKPISAECAVACAKAGSPLVILSDDGSVYWPIADTTPASGQNERLLPFAGQKVAASGKVFQRGGSSALVIEKIERLSDQK